MKIQKKNERTYQRGQSIIEYILLVAAVISFLIVFFGPGGYFQRAYNRTIQQQGDDILNVAVTLFN